MKRITSSSDVKVGDRVLLVDWRDGSRCEGVVTKVMPGQLTIRTDEGKRKTAKVPTHTGERWLVGPRDLWRRTQPSAPLLEQLAEGLRAAARDASVRAALHAQIDATVDWLATEPQEKP